MSWWRLTPISLLLAACCAAPAAAAAPSIGTPEFEQLVQVATAHWPAQPCSGEVEYAYADLPGTTVGYASWMQPALAPPDPLRFSSCRIDIETDLEVEAATLCTVVAHELGHLLGHNHAADPADVMYANLRGPLAACEAAFPAPAEVAEVATVLTPEVAAAPAPKVKRQKRGRGRSKSLRRASASRRQHATAGSAR